MSGNGAFVERIEMKVNERSFVTLAGRASAGYQWHVEIDDPTVVSAEPVLTEASANGEATWSGEERFILVGLSAGATMVRFSQRRAFGPPKPPLAVREIAVTVG